MSDTHTTIDPVTRYIWRRMAKERKARGISPGYAAKQLGIQSGVLWRIERQGCMNMMRLSKYAKAVLRCRLLIELPPMANGHIAITLVPLDGGA